MRLYDNIIIYIFSKRGAAKDVIRARRMHGQLAPAYKYSNTRVTSGRYDRLGKSVQPRRAHARRLPEPCALRLSSPGKKRASRV